MMESECQRIIFINYNIRFDLSSETIRVTSLKYNHENTFDYDFEHNIIVEVLLISPIPPSILC